MVSMLTGSMSTILSRLGYAFIPIETLFSQWGYQNALIGEPLGTGDSDAVCNTISRLGDTFIPIETLFSQWGYQKAPIGEPLGDSDVVCNTIISWLGDTFIPLETKLAQWGYQKAPIYRSKWVDRFWVKTLSCIVESGQNDRQNQSKIAPVCTVGSTVKTGSRLILTTVSICH